MIDNPSTASIVSKDSKIVGKLEINLIPVDEDGESEVPDENFPDSPEELIDRRIDFLVNIIRAFDLPEDFCKDPFCEYTFFLSEERFSTPSVPGKIRSPEFKFRYHHTIEPVTDTLLNYLLKDSLCIKIYAFPDFNNKKEPAKKVPVPKKKKSKESSVNVSNNDSTRDISGSSFDSSDMQPQDKARSGFNVVKKNHDEYTNNFLNQDDYVDVKKDLKKHKAEKMTDGHR